MKPFSRADRVAGQIQKVLSEVLKKRVRDPRVQLATISSVKMSADLKNAKIYFMVPGGETNKRDATDGFHCALGYLKRILARRLGLRYMPNLKFFYDESFDYGDHIDTLLRSIRQKDGSDSTSIEEQ